MMGKNTRKTKRPIDAKTHNQLCSLQRDNLGSGNFWMLLNEKSVVLCAQKTGESPTATIEIPRRDFDRFVKWYAGVS